MLEQFLAFLKEHAGEGATALSKDEAKKLAAQLKGNAATQPLYQAIYDTGFSTSHVSAGEREQELRTQLEEAQKAKGKLEERIQKLQEEQPDVGKLEAQFQDELAERDTTIRELKQQHAKALDDIAQDNAVTDLERRLVQAGVNPKWARVEAEQHRGRLKPHKGEDGKRAVQVLKEAGGVSTLQAEDPMAALADEVKAGVDPEFITSNAERGSDVKNGGEGPSKTVFDRVREQAKNDRDRQQRQGPSGLERLRSPGAGARPQEQPASK